MKLVEGILSRSSARKLAEPGPDAEALNIILSCGVAAPDHGRLEPWRFVVITGAGRSRLGEAMAAARQRCAPDSSELTLRAERDKALRAPVIIAVAARIQPGKISHSDQLLAVAACVQNMFLAATDLGFGAMWKTGSAASDEGVKLAIGLDPDDQIIAFLYLGTVEIAGQQRRPVADAYTHALNH